MDWLVKIILVRQNDTRSNSCSVVDAGFRADVQGIITVSSLLHFIANNVDFGIPIAAERSLMILLWKCGTSFTASRTSSWFHFLGLPHLCFWGLERNWRMSGFSKFSSARAQTLLIFCLHTWKSRATTGIVPRANLPSSPWSLSSLRSLETNHCLTSRVYSFFLLRSCKGLKWGSGSGGSIAVSYRVKTQNRQFRRPKNSIMSIYVDAPAFKHMHGLIEFILWNAKRMMFWVNARILSTEGQRGSTKPGRREYQSHPKLLTSEVVFMSSLSLDLRLMLQTTSPPSCFQDGFS